MNNSLFNNILSNLSDDALELFVELVDEIGQTTKSFYVEKSHNAIKELVSVGFVSESDISNNEASFISITENTHLKVKEHPSFLIAY